MNLFLLLVSALVAFVVLRAVWTFLTCRTAHLPGPWWSRSPLLSTILFARAALKGKRHLFQENLWKNYGKVARMNPSTVTVADSAICTAALAVGDSGWRKDPRIYGSDKDGTRSLFSYTDPDKHKLLRRKLSPAFSIKSISEMEPIVRDVIHAFLERLDNMAKTGDSGDFLHLYSLFTGDVIGEVAFGDRWGLVTQGHSEVLEHSERMVRVSLAYNAFGPLKNIAARYIPMIRDGLASIKWMDDYAMKVVKDRRSGLTARRDDLLQRICDAEDPDTHEKLTDKEVANNCVLFIAAGDETTSHQLSFVTYHLLANPDKLANLRAELDQTAKDNGVTGDKIFVHSDVKDLPYLNAVLNESLRLLPTTYTITRRVVPAGGWQHPKDSSIFLPEGTSISIVNGALCRDKEIFGEDADKFVPERWIGEKGIKEADVRWSWMPFSRGPRVCFLPKSFVTSVSFADALQSYRTVSGLGWLSWK